MLAPITVDRYQALPMKDRILVVEDEPSILDNILYSLETDGFTPVGCHTGEAAVDQLKERSFDIAILDVGLPDISGFDLFRAIRESSDIPIIFLTARAEEVDRIVGLEIGADDYVVKPFSPRELNARIRAVLRRYHAGVNPQPAKEVPPSNEGDCPLVIDEEKVKALYHGEPVMLSTTEFRVLTEFSKHPGRVYSRAQLMDIAWSEPDASMERTVDAHIKSLRAKLKKIRPIFDPIETHRGLGYSLKEEWE